MGLEVVEGDRNMEEQAIVLNLGGWVVGVGRILPVVGGGMLVDFVDSFVGGYGLGMGLLIDDRIGGSLMRRIAGC
jgi:hypothetical protein